MEREQFRMEWERLCKFFKPTELANKEKALEYYKRVEDADYRQMVNAVDAIIDGERFFPTPGVLREKVWASSMSEKRGKKLGCRQCENGFVQHYLPDHEGRLTESANPCAYCLPLHAGAQVVVKGRQVFFACEEATFHCLSEARKGHRTNFQKQSEVRNEHGAAVWMSEEERDSWLKGTLSYRPAQYGGIGQMVRDLADGKGMP